MLLICCILLSLSGEGARRLTAPANGHVGSWGSLEYGSAGAPGQVVGGRWRPLHYLYASAIFVDVLAACGADGFCFVRNDGVAAWQGTVTAFVLEFGTGKRTAVGPGRAIALPGGAGQLHRFCLGGGSPEAGGGCNELQAAVDGVVPGCFGGGGAVHCALEMHACPSTGGCSPTGAPPNLLLLGPPMSLALPVATVNATVVGDGLHLPVTITVAADALALFVVLTTAAQGRFSDNAFTLSPGQSRTLDWVPFSAVAGGTGPGSIEELRRTLRVEHLAENLVA